MRNFLRRLTFNIWYYFNPPWDSGISPPELLDYIKNYPAGRAIDIGCGTGTNVITLALAGWQVTGVDFVPRAIQTAKRKTSAAVVEAEFLVRDATDLKGIRGPFDLALDIGCFHSLGEQKRDYLSELERILSPGGHWLMYGFFHPAQSLRAPERVSEGGDPQSTPGLGDADLELIATSMSLVWRQDGFDRGERASAWFLYRHTR